jgi:hypothetical protein
VYCVFLQLVSEFHDKAGYSYMYAVDRGLPRLFSDHE